MKTRFYLSANTDTFFFESRVYDTREEAELNKEFLERYYGMGIRVRLKVIES